MSPLLILGGVAALFALMGGSKKSAKTGNGGASTPGGVEDTPRVPPPAEPGGTPATPGPTMFTIRSGDYPSALAAYYTGQPMRFKELASLNPHLGTLKTIKGVSNYPGWQIGVQIELPPSWDAQSRPLPKPGSTQAMVA